MAAGPETAKIPTEDEEQTADQPEGVCDTGHRHQDQQSGILEAFVKAPENHISRTQPIIDTRYIIDTQVAEAVRIIVTIGG